MNLSEGAKHLVGKIWLTKREPLDDAVRRLHEEHDRAKNEYERSFVNMSFVDYTENGLTPDEEQAWEAIQSRFNRLTILEENGMVPRIKETVIFSAFKHRSLEIKRLPVARVV